MVKPNHVLQMLTLLLLLLTVIISGCGRAAPSNDFVAEQASLAMGPAGGNLSLQLADGMSFHVEIPAGALTSQTTLTLTTQKPVGGQRFNLLLQPAGLVLASGSTATLTITLPSGSSLPTGGALVYDSALIPFTRLPDGSLQIVLSAFAGTPADAVSGASDIMKIANHAKALVRQNIIMAALTSTCDSVPYMDSNEGLSAVDAVDIELYGQCMISAVQALALNEQFAEAVRVASSVAAYLQKTGAGSADTLVMQAQGIACTAYGLALDRANSTTVTTMGTLYNLVKPILFWETTVQQIGATCSSIPADRYQTVINAKTGEAIAYYDQQKPNMTSTSSTDYASAKTEAAQSAQAKTEVLALNPPSAVRQTVASEISQRAQPGLLDSMLQAPWNRCRNTADYGELIYLMTTMDGPAAVKSAAQYCGTVLTAWAQDSQGSITAQLAQPIGGISAAVTETSDDLNADKTSIVVLNGPIQALQCPSGYAGGSENLTIALDGTVVSTLSSAPYLNNQLAIDLATALEAAYPGATGNLTSASLTVTRDGAPCDGYWGANPTPLLTLTLSLTKTKKIAFSRNGDIYVINPDGSGETQLTSGTDTDDRNPTWSPDRTRLAFSRSFYDATNGWIAQIYTMNADGSGITALTSDTAYQSDSPAWSPEGSKIAFIRVMVGQGWGDIYTMNSDGSGITRLTDGSASTTSNFGPSWSSDSSQIAFYRFDQAGSTGWDIYVMNTDGSGPSQVASTNDTDMYPSWSPDGTKIAFTKYNASSVFDIFTMNANGTGQSALTSGSSTSDKHPSWSPDGAKITFDRDNSSIYIINADGSGLTLLTSGITPAW